VTPLLKQGDGVRPYLPPLVATRNGWSVGTVFPAHTKILGSFVTENLIPPPFKGSDADPFPSWRRIIRVGIPFFTSGAKPTVFDFLHL